MSREQSMLALLHTAAKMQWNLAMILEAKAVEAEKVRSWICGHMRADDDGTDRNTVKDVCAVHAQVIETIEGITKLSQALNGTLKALLQGGDEGAGGGLGGMFGGGFGSEDA